ncbi:hypothetical protein F5148DRAFT_1175405 [Russula earlei]|uniref:Uncharacterized protein n=1 Tax=Russula earlei TaxID=71964 RepID=A0ACC0UJD5_9AGAM|nr:hypothetical protein F5148DRAFT_1175405 [Russula earlei]
MAREARWECEKVWADRFPPMFPDDPGEEGGAVDCAWLEAHPGVSLRKHCNARCTPWYTRDCRGARLLSYGRTTTSQRKAESCMLPSRSGSVAPVSYGLNYGKIL